MVNAINLKIWDEPREHAMSNKPAASGQNIDGVIATKALKNSAAKLIINKRFQKSESWISKYNLYTDKQIQAADAWLNDRIIAAVNKMVSKQLGSESNQSTLLVQKRSGFKPVTCELIIILHDVNHWVTTAYIEGEVLYLDSLVGSALNYVKAQMRQLCWTSFSRK